MDEADETIKGQVSQHHYIADGKGELSSKDQISEAKAQHEEIIACTLSMSPEKLSQNHQRYWNPQDEANAAKPYPYTNHCELCCAHEKCIFQIYDIIPS